MGGQGLAGSPLLAVLPLPRHPRPSRPYWDGSRGMDLHRRLLSRSPGHAWSPHAWHCPRPRRGRPWWPSTTPRWRTLRMR
jgi:hypothetical protein